MLAPRPTVYAIDPDDPRAPPQEVWDRLTEEERAWVVSNLPSEIAEAMPGEGDPHFEAKALTRQTLRSYFDRIGRKVYLACELPIYYPDEPWFAPDVSAIMDVATHPRMSWVVSAEGKGIDLAIEVHVAGDKRKDLERNVERYARLGIQEYFIFDRGKLRLSGYRLEGGSRTYRRIVPQRGRYESQVLGLDLSLDDTKLRFFHGTAPLLEADEMINRLEEMMSQVEEHRAEELRRVEEEAAERVATVEKKLAEEARMRAEAEQKLAAALEEIERLRRGS